MAFKNNIAWYYFSSPKNFYPLAGKLIPWFWALTIIPLVIGLYMSFFVAPTDYKQGESYRIIFIHVPAAWMSMLIYLVMAGYAAIGLAWKLRMAEMMAKGCEGMNEGADWSKIMKTMCGKSTKEAKTQK